ncbi:uncharacterized protein LOC135401317 [Ornithodoros turicata]
MAAPSEIGGKIVHSVSSGRECRKRTTHSKDLLRSEVVSRDEHLLSLLHSTGPPKTFQMKSTLLEKAKVFLPQMEKAEKERLSGKGDDLNIEVEATSDEPMIEMNFALVEAAEDSFSDCTSESESSSSDVEEENAILVDGCKLKLPSRTSSSKISDVNKEPGT